MRKMGEEEGMTNEFDGRGVREIGDGKFSIYGSN